MISKFSPMFLIILVFLFIISALPLQGWTPSQALEDNLPWDVEIRFRTAYFHPASSKVRKIYGDGWADYQLEISKGIECNWNVWAGVSGFSRKGSSLGIHHRSTKLQLVPIYLGVRYSYPITKHIDLYLGAGGCYSFLNIRDKAYYVHEHTRKQGWGGVFQSGVNFTFCNFTIGFFFDYFLQRFHIRNIQFSSASRSSCCLGCASCPCHGSRFTCCSSSSSSNSDYVKRINLNMSGYKVGGSIGISF